jgi:hypothetical protein
LRWVIDESGEFPDLPKFDQLTDDQVVSMGGGVDAATYLVKGPDRDVVVKLNSEGLEAEARALRAWTPYTERVPEVLGLGTVPSSENPPIRYLLLPALKNDDGEVVENRQGLPRAVTGQRPRAGARSGRRAAPHASGGLLAGFWETYSGDLAAESLVTAQLVQAILQAEHRQDRLNNSDTDTVDVEVTHEFIRTIVDKAAT